MRKEGKPLFFCGLFRMRIVCYIGRRNTRKGSTKDKPRKKNKKYRRNSPGNRRIYEAIERPEGTGEKSRGDTTGKEWVVSGLRCFTAGPLQFLLSGPEQKNSKKICLRSNKDQNGTIRNEGKPSMAGDKIATEGKRSGKGGREAKKEKETGKKAVMACRRGWNNRKGKRAEREKGKQE